MLKKKTAKNSKRKTKKKIKIVSIKKPSKKNRIIKKIQLSKDIIISSISKVLKVSKKKNKYKFRIRKYGVLGFLGTTFYTF